GHREILEFGYRPLGALGAAMRKDRFQEARAIARRKEELRREWDGVRIENLSVTETNSGNLGLGDTFEVSATVDPGSIAPGDLEVELFIGRSNGDDELKEPSVLTLARTGERDGLLQFGGGFMPSEAGSFRYGVRVRPRIENEIEGNDLGLVQWA
ncbi:MAG: hypothetical protein AAGD14_15355, partial [Planctomycetota bacterium]